MIQAFDSVGGGDSKATEQNVPLQCKDAALGCLGGDFQVGSIPSGLYPTIIFTIGWVGDPRHEACAHKAWPADHVAYLEVTWSPLGLTICSVR